MFKTLKESLDINLTFKTNSFIYNLKRFPIIKRLFKDSIYGDRDLKKILKVIAIIFNIIKTISFRLFYFFIILLISLAIDTELKGTFITVFTLFTFIGGLINNTLLAPKVENYFMVVLFNVDATNYMKLEIFKEVGLDILLDFIMLSRFGVYLHFNIVDVLLLCALKVLIRIIGEAIELSWFTHHQTSRNGKSIINIVGSLIFLSLISLTIFNMYVNTLVLAIIVSILFILSIFAYKYLMNYKDYKMVFKRINTLSNVMMDETVNQDIAFKDKDVVIDAKKISGKHGYDLFNAIFVERHRRLLYKSARNFSLIIAGLYLIVSVGITFIPEFKVEVNNMLLNSFSFFPLAFYYINRGQMITRAMFFHSDHAMLSYNFFRKPKVILGLFRRRLKSLILINMLPALVIGLGNSILFYLTGNTSITTYISSFVFVLSLTIFFSIHYLVLYYLLQPFTESMTMKKGTYTFMVAITYLVCYYLTDLKVSTLTFSIGGTLFAVLYTIISYLLVMKYAPKTFKIN